MTAQGKVKKPLSKKGKRKVGFTVTYAPRGKSRRDRRRSRQSS